MRTSAFPWSARTALGMALLFCGSIACLPTPTRAADREPAAPETIETPWLTQSMAVARGALKSLGSGAASAWSNVAGLVAPSQPAELLPDRISDDDQQFFAVMDTVGLRVSEIRLGGSLVTSSSYRFVAERAPSVADLDRAERKLDGYRSTSDGLRARAKQRIARSVLDLTGAKDFALTAVVIELSPWPSVSYEMNARNRPPEAAERRVVDGMQTQ